MGETRDSPQPRQGRGGAPRHTLPFLPFHQRKALMRNGVVKDWATGSVQGSASDCVQYIGGIINRCNDMRQLQASLALYDVRVATKAGRPISSRGEPAAPAVN